MRRRAFRPFLRSAAPAGPTIKGDYKTYFGSIGNMFAALAHARPTHLTMPGATANLGHASVHLHGSPDIPGLLHVAALIRGRLYRQKR